MMSETRLVLLLSVLSFASAKSPFINLGGGIICPREEKGLGRCIRDFLNGFVPQLGRGIPEFGIPSCEPLIVPEVEFEQAKGPVSLKSMYRDITVRGPSKSQIKSIKIDSINKVITAKLFIPELRLKGRYLLQGEVLMLPIEGEGLFSGNYTKIDATVTVKLGKTYQDENGKVRLPVDDLVVKFKVDNGHIIMDNLFGGDEQMGQMMNKFLNDNWKKVSKELQPVLEQSLQQFLKPLADKAFSLVNAEDLFSS